MDRIQELERRIEQLETQFLLLSKTVLEQDRDTWVDTDTCCEKLGIHRTTLERWRKRGILDIHYKIHGERKYRYNWREFQKLFEGK